MLWTVSWLLLIHLEPFCISPLTLSMVLLTAGSSPFPSSSTLLCICCFSTWNFCSGVLLMASAISSVTDIPFFMLPCKSCIPLSRVSTLLYKRSIRATASSVPKASFSSLFSTASMVSPYLLFSSVRMSGIDSSWLLVSRKVSPNFSPALDAWLRKDLYFVAASEPDIVVWSCPIMASCSSSGTLAFVAVAPSADIALAISEPDVL